MAKPKSRKQRRKPQSTPQAPSSDEVADQIIQEVKIEKRRRLMRRLKIGLPILVGAIVLLGVITHFIGIGAFGYRLTLYGNNQIFLFNQTDLWVFISIDGSTPVEVGPRSTKWAPLIGGTSRIVTTDEEGKVLEELEVFSDNANIFYHIEFEDKKCLVYVDVTPYYQKNRAKIMKIEKRILPSEPTFEIPSENVILPTKTFPDQLVGDSDKVIWVEIMNCHLLEDEENDQLIYELLNTWFRNRRQRFKEKKRLYEENLKREGAW